jgi:PAS domain S-box-containing protein
MIKQCFKGELEFFELEMRMKHKGGNYVWVNVRGKIFEWSLDGKAMKMYGTMIEISKRKNAELKLLEERSLLRTIIDSSPDSIYVKDLEGRKIIANKADVALCGASTEGEILGKTDEEIFPPEVSKGTSQIEERVLVRGESILNEEGVLTGKDGNQVWLLTSKFPMYDQEGKISGLVGMGRNITKRKKAEQEVIYSRSLLEALYILSPIGIALNDFETGKFLDGNQMLLEPTGYTKEEFEALSYWDVTPKEYEPLEIKALEQMKSKGAYDLFEKEYIRKDGTRYPVALQGVVVEDSRGEKLIWSFIRDISEEKEASRKLQEALAKLNAILDASTQVSIIATEKNGVINLFNSGAEKLTGYKAEELIGKYTPQIIHLESEVLKEEELLSEKEGKFISGFDVFVNDANKGKFSTKEWTYKRKDGFTVPVLLSITAIRQDEEIIGYLGVAADISELKKVESEIKSLLDITQDQNRRLRNFAHIVSHNLRSHSSGISGLLDIFQYENPELKENELLQLVHQGATNLMQTVEDLTEVVNVNLSKKEKTSINLKRIVQKNLDSLAAQISLSKVKVQNLVDGEIEIEGITAYLDSITLNFITNAIKYRSSERSATLDILTEVTEDKVMLHFKDNGQGIDLEKYGDQLFGMYKTFHQHDDSRGVGLFITKNQIESMGGTIEVESTVGVGTTFKIILPYEKN